jgi:hypothetical protein
LLNCGREKGGRKEQNSQGRSRMLRHWNPQKKETLRLC